MKPSQIGLVLGILAFSFTLGFSVTEWKISNCPIVRQYSHGPYWVCGHDCDADGIEDRVCVYRVSEIGVETISCNGH